MNSSFTRTVVLAIVVGVLLAVGAWLLFRTQVAPPPEPPRPVVVERPVVDAGQVAPEARADARVVAVTGLAERSATGDAGWVALKQGDPLVADDRIRTAKGGELTLQVGDSNSRITVPESSELAIGQLTAAVHSFKVGHGRIGVDYQRDDKRVLRLTSENGAVAETRGAKFTVLSTGTTIAVATESGSVNLSAAGQSVEVGPGQQSVVLGQGAPSEVAPIPTSVLLEVAKVASGGNELCASLQGLVRPGTALEVDGNPVNVDREGRYNVTVPRRPGLKSVRVVALEPSGKRSEKEIACKEARAGPKDEADFQWGN